MAKKRKKQKACALPPEGLWIKPDGRAIEVTEHLIAIGAHPELFDLARQPGLDIKELRDIAVELIKDGWTRYRYLNNTHLFEVNHAKEKLSLIEDILVRVGAHDFEDVTISQIQPINEWTGLVSDVYERRILRFQNNPLRMNSWRFSRK